MKRVMKFLSNLSQVVFLLFLLLVVVMAIGRDNKTAIIAGIIWCVLTIFFITQTVKDAKTRKTQKQKQIAHPSVDEMTGVEYERYCGAMLVNTGLVKSIKYTPTTNDYGADIIAYMKDGTKVAVQCKRYSGRVGNSAVQEIVAAMPHYNASGAMIITNSALTENAKRLAAENNVTIVEYFK